MSEILVCDIDDCSRKATHILWDTWYDREMHVCKYCFNGLVGRAGFEEGK